MMCNKSFQSLGSENPLALALILISLLEDAELIKASMLSVPPTPAPDQGGHFEGDPMRRSTLLLAVAALAVAIPASAKMPFVAKAKAAGVADAKCASCHEGAPKKGGAFTAMGKFANDHQKDGEPDWVAFKKQYGK